ncbi:CRISPR-associated endoribonuclease Cas6 [Sphingobacterium faecium]|uniref:CRISPR-associated endoribonuclease Cas6 n=1 Tax=Sphingobacterium faecium TaxID=34087 RepID=UPI001291CACE|nr:CRISPR-associated endoribonuclease Cas6 [Sphingobacterium faecium]MQP26392.1 CRISPR-associated endoribonuclease Cas6 [Sphingobacterium faecium]
MQFKITLLSKSNSTIIPINYQYPLSSAIYKIIAKGDREYANFLHESGYGKGFKLFCFSQISCPFKIENDRLRLLNPELSFYVSFHLPETMENFVKGLFQSETLDIADHKSKISFNVKSVESLPNRLTDYKENELINISMKPLSPIVASMPRESGISEYLAPSDPRFIESLIYNWRSKIATCYNEQKASEALLLLETISFVKSAKSRLITIKADAAEETKIKGWWNFGLKVTAERRFVELLLNSGIGRENSMGLGFVEIVL